MTNPLDRPIWYALAGRQAGFAVGAGLARRFQAKVSPFIACANDSPEALAAVAGLAARFASVVQWDGALSPHFAIAACD